MFQFLSQKPWLGIEITAAAVRLGAATGSGAELTALASHSAAVPNGVVVEDYAAPNIHDMDALAGLLRECLRPFTRFGIKRAALSLPDGVFRVQILEFDELPSKARDRERLIRWRLEKSAAFDVSDTVLRYEMLTRQEKGFTLLACSAKRDVLTQYESLLSALGLEPWVVGLCSFHALNFYAPALSQSLPALAFAYITDAWFATIVMEGGGPRFYRYREIKKGKADDAYSRLMRDIDDSLHFYTHRDRTQSQAPGPGHLYLVGDASLPDSLSEGLRAMTGLDVGTLSPAEVLAKSGGTAGVEETLFAPVLGAGGLLS